MKPGGLLAAATAVALGACDGGPADLALRRSAIIGGQPDAADAAVVAVAVCHGTCLTGGAVSQARLHEYCTGVLVAPRVVLTACHCLAPLASVDGSNRC